jgi:hypothetical protein
MNLWWSVAGSFLAGVSVGVIGAAAVERGPAEPVAAASDATHVTDREVLSSEPVGFVSGTGAARRVATPVGDSDPRWVAVEQALTALRERVSVLEEQVAELAPAGPFAAEGNSRSAAAGGMDQQTLVAAGVDPVSAADIMRRQSRLEMQRLQLRDQASREGWLNSARYAEALRELGGDARALRQQIGDDAYDRFLYLTGQPNRVLVASVIDESPAQMAGIQAGDLVLQYADSRVFAYGDLSNATRAGERGEYVLVRIQRRGDLLELSVPRGPLGIRLDQDQIDPDADRQQLVPE